MFRPLFNLRVKARARTIAILATAVWLVGCSTMQAPVPAPALPAAVPLALEPAPPVVVPDARAPTAPRPAPKRRLAATPPVPADAVPRIERIATGHPNAPYSIKGIGYEPLNEDVPMKETGVASWYGADFHGKPSSTGERFDMRGMSAAHPTMPLPSYAIVRNLDNGRQVIVRVNDRGPFIGNRIIDLSFAAAKKLGITGLGHVEVERITHADIRTGAWKLQAPEAQGIGLATTPGRAMSGTLASTSDP